MRVYLSGGMRSNWQDNVKSRCSNIRFLDPRLHGLDCPEQYTVWDLEAIKICDVVFAYLEKDNPSGIGLSVEVGYALGLGKTVILVNEKQDHYTDILNSSVNFWCDLLEIGIIFLHHLSLAYLS